MIFIDEATVEQRLDYVSLTAALRRGFSRREEYEVPLRQAHVIRETLSGRDSLLSMPAWRKDGLLGVKLVTAMVGSGKPGRPAISAVMILFDSVSGQPVALVDGEALTRRRTAAASALAAQYLARPDSRSLLVVGTGSLCPHMARAHCAARTLETVWIWGRNPKRAQSRVDELRAEGIEAQRVTDLDQAVRRADIISCATTTRSPLIEGRWLRPGQHLDLVGGFAPDMREVDDEAIVKSAIFVDTREGALAEAGDLTQPISAGLIRQSDIRAELAELCLGTAAGRRNPEEITLFKSVGAAIEDVIAAELVLRAVRDDQAGPSGGSDPERLAGFGQG